MEKFKAKILNLTNNTIPLTKYGFEVYSKPDQSFFHAIVINSNSEKDLVKQEVPVIFLTKNKEIVNNEDVFSLNEHLEEIFDFAFSKLDPSYLNSFKEMGDHALHFIENSLIKNFKVVAKEDLIELKLMLEEKDIDKIKSKCHKMKSTFSTLGLVKTTNILNDYAKCAKDFNEYDYYKLYRNYESDCLFLDEYLNELKENVI